MIMLRFLPLILICMFVSACSNRQPARMPEEILNYESSAYQKDDAWWTVFADPQLNDLVETALARNIDYAKSAVAINLALYQANLIGADLVPTFSASSAGNLQKQTNTGAIHTKSFSAGIEVAYEIDLWRKLSAAVTAREWELGATVLDRESVRLTLISRVIDTYFELLYLGKAIEISESYVDNHKNILNATTARYTAGKTDALEKEQASQALLAAQNTLLEYQLAFADAEQALRLLLNFSPDAPLSLTVKDLQEISSTSLDEQLPVAVLAERPDLRAAAYRLQSAYHDLQAAQRAWFPSVTLGASYGSEASEIGKIFTAPLAVGTLTVKLPFLDWNRVRWNVRISEAEYDDLLLDYERTFTTALNEVHHAWFSYRNHSQRYENLRSKLLHDSNINVYYEKRYRIGRAEFKDWLAALNTELLSRLELLEARYQQLGSECLIYKTMAGRYVQRNF